VVQYEMKTDGGAALPDPPAMSVASLNTHDMPPFAGFLQGEDLNERQRAGLLSPQDAANDALTREALIAALNKFLQTNGYSVDPCDAQDVLRGCLDYLSDSPARMLLVNLEDLWLETKSQNIPSTGENCKNWSRKMQPSWGEISRDPGILQLLQSISNAVAPGKA